LILLPLIIWSVLFIYTQPSQLPFFTQVKLPNGQFANVTHIGTVRISIHLILTDVLYVPSFSFNLLSTSKFIKQFNYCFIFLANHCFIQNLVTWMTIGVGREKDRLYYLLQKHGLPDKSVSTPKSISFSRFSASIKNVSNNVWLEAIYPILDSNCWIFQFLKFYVIQFLVLSVH
jgi:hypothetical protein